jgi:DNA polymerase-1
MVRYIALDIETEKITTECNAARHRKAKMFSAAIAYKSGGRIKSIAKPWTRKWRDYLAKLAEDDNNIFVFHNVSFDVAALRLRGVNIRDGQYRDTMLLSYLIEPAEKHSLKEVAKRCGIRDGKIEFHDFSKLSKEMLVYNARDAELTLKLYHILDAELRKDPEAYKEYVEIDLPYLRVILEMEKTGFTLNKEALEALEVKTRRELLRLEARLHELVPYVPGKEKIYKSGKYTRGGVTTYDHCQLLQFNPNSTAHIEWALKAAGWKPGKDAEKTKSGKLSLAKNVLESLASKFELAKALVDFRKVTKLHGTYLMKWRQNLDGLCRIYANFNYTATRTGRLSSSGGTAGNLQNIPARGEMGTEIRKLVVAPEGYNLVIGDLSNFEARVLAHYLATVMGDGALAEAFINKLDLHQFNADKIGITRPEAKTLLYLYLYGGQAARLAKSLGVSVQRAEEILKSLEVNFPALANFRSVVIKMLKKRGGVLHDKLGRRLVYREILSRDKRLVAKAERQIVNSLMQGLNATVMRQLTNDSWDIVKEYGGKFVGSIHDEIIVMVPKAMSKIVADKLTKVWSSSQVLAPVPIVTEFKAVSNWSEAK